MHSFIICRPWTVDSVMYSVQHIHSPRRDLHLPNNKQNLQFISFKLGIRVRWRPHHVARYKNTAVRRLFAGGWLIIYQL